MQRQSVGSSSMRWWTQPGKHDLSELRSYQDWYLRYYLQSVPGVAEVAPIGGFVRQYQVTVDPNKLAGYGISVDMVMEAIRKNNNDVGGRLVEFSQREYMVRGRGYAKTTDDIERIAVMTDPKTGTPVHVRDIGRVALGPDIRRGVADLDGKGDAVGGIIVMRYGENALKVIERVKKKLKEIEPTLPEGVQVVATYDRADLIDRSIETLKGTLTEELHHRKRGDPDLSMARSQRRDSHFHDPYCRNYFLHSYVWDEDHFQHHVAWVGLRLRSERWSMRRLS